MFQCRSRQGAPGISTRLMVALHCLKFQHDLSDENVVAHWIEDPYRQQFSGERHFPAPVAHGRIEHDAL
jgi:transposase, IS5 family